MTKIAIIGGGPSSVSLCRQICDSHELTDDLEITVFEKGNTIGAGLPYCLQDANYILNLPANNMEPVYKATGFFAKWLPTQPDYIPNSVYPPRFFFGRYLLEMSKVIQKMAADKGITINYKIDDEVTSVELQEDSNIYSITSSSGRYHANYIILATGHMPATAFRNLQGLNGYEHNPWEGKRQDSSNSKEDVVIIGTRLTAIDTALRLNQMNHSGKIHMVSRTGLLPTVLTPDIKIYPLHYLTARKFDELSQGQSANLLLDDLLDLFWQEISEALGIKTNMNNIIKSSQQMGSILWLKQEIQRAQANNSPWQQILFAFYTEIPKVWNMLTPTDQQRYMSEYHSLFMTYLAAFPLENAYKIQHMLTQGKLTISGGLESITQDKDSGFIINLKDGSFKAQRVINATGSGYDLSTIPLYEKMIESKLVSQHILGGLKVNPQTLQVYNSKLQLNKNMFAIGELTRGTCLLTADMSCVASQAKYISSYLKKTLLANPKVAVDYEFARARL